MGSLREGVKEGVALAEGEVKLAAGAGGNVEGGDEGGFLTEGLGGGGVC